MAAMNEKQLKDEIKNKSFSNVYFFYGEEHYLKEHYVNLLKKKIVDPAFADFNFHSYEGNDTSLDEIIRDAETFPMMSEYTFLLVRDYPFDRSVDEANAMKEFLKDVPETTIMVFVYDTVQIDVKKNSKWKSIITAFSKAGSSVNFEKCSEGDLIKLLINGAKRRNATLDSNTARYLISVSGSDLNTLLNELEKLAMYANGGEITKKIVDNMAIKCLQARVYDLSKAIVKGDSDSALAVLDILFQMKESAIAVLAVIGGCYVDMYRVKCAKIAGKPCEDVGEYYNYRGREFALRNALRDGSKISVEALRSSLDVIALADIKLKSTSIDSKVVLEETIVKLLILSGEAA